jgi:hypothetical protein
MVVNACNPSYWVGVKIGGLSCEVAWANVLDSEKQKELGV